MLFKSVLLLGAMMAANVSAHAAIDPALGVKGTAARKDVQRPSTNKPCGNIAVTALDTSTAVAADASGSFTVDVQNFNAGRDGSRQVTMQVDAAGTGTNFVAGQVTANGQAAPATTGTEKVTASLPAGTTCSGGAAKNKCLVSFKTAGGFGNCVVVQQGAAGGAAAGGNAAAGNVAAGNAAAGNAAAGNTGAAAGKGNGNGGAKNNGGTAATGNTGAAGNNRNGNNKAGGNANVQNKRRVAGTRLARYVVVDQD